MNTHLYCIGTERSVLIIEVSESSFRGSIRETPLLLVIGLQLILIPQFLLHVEENSNKTLKSMSANL